MIQPWETLEYHITFIDEDGACNKANLGVHSFEHLSDYLNENKAHYVKILAITLVQD